MSADPNDGRHQGELESDWQDLYEHAPCAYLSTLPDGTIVRANHTFLEWLGAEREQIVGVARFQSLLSVGSRIYYETHYSPLLQMQGFVNEIALEIRRSDGAVRPVVASARQLRDADGTARVNRVALFDSTDRRKYERELVQAQKRAEQSARELANANRQKTEFIAMLAHELRSPLAPVRNALDVLRQSRNDERVVDRTTGIMRRQVGQIVRLVEDLFDISRVGQDKLSLRRVPVDLGSVIHHAAEASAPLLEESGIAYRAQLPDNPIYVEADAARLVQVVGNILNNAAKFTPRGGSVSLTVERVGDAALIRIRDTGIGIATEALPRIFDMFMQAEGTIESRSGLGIGLTLAKSLVDRHDGTISVQSEGLGLGTEFVVRLPALTEAPESVSKAMIHISSDTAAVPRRVLVVDDNRDSADVMALLLQFAGHKVLVAYDGAQALDACTSFDPEVVLLDIGLPILDGYEVARQIRARPGRQPLLIALTGWGELENRRRSQAAGFDAHLVKPVDRDALMKLIDDPRPGD